MAWMDRLKEGLSKARSEFAGSLESVLKGGKKLSADQLEQIEEILIAGDVSVSLAMEFTQGLAECSRRELADGGLMEVLKRQVREKLQGCERKLALRNNSEPTVVTITGVNGSGKTTTAAKIASRLRAQQVNIPITLAAADTFRAAAIDQLTVWADRVGADLISHKVGADPSAVVFDAIDHVQHVGGVLLIDTAGRLQTKHNLMQELSKIERTVIRKLGRSSDERLLVLDASTGQNGISQATRFHEAIDLTGIVITKLDGTSKGGVVLSIWDQLRLPLIYIGVGEDKEDLHEFSAQQFVEALFLRK
jgi:fused signal recognition particle receptor